MLRLLEFNFKGEYIIIMNLYIGDCECNSLVEQATKFHYLCFSPIDSNKFYIFCDMEGVINE